MAGRLNTGVGQLQDLRARMSDVEAVVPTSRTLTTGVTTTNDPGGPNVTSGGHSFVTAFTAPQYRIRISKIRMLLRGDGPGGAGNQKAKGVAYLGAGASALPTAPLIAQGTEINATNPSAAQLWEFTMPTTALVEANAQFSAGVFFDNIFPSVNQAMTIPYVTAAANTLLENTDTYADGAVSPFGSIHAGYTQLPLIEVDVESAPATYDGEISSLDSRLDEVETDIDGLQTGGSTTTDVETATPLAALDVYYGEPVDCTSGRLVVWRARTDVAGTIPTMEIQESVSGATWYPVIRPDGYSATETTGESHFTGEMTASSVRYTRLVYYNGGTIQSLFELVRSVA